MSRASPFPTNAGRRDRSGSVASHAYDPQSPPGSSTRPLQINRPPSRPTTPSSMMSRSATPSGPSRPQRSELRSRTTSEDRTDSFVSARSDVSRGSQSRTMPRPSRNGTMDTMRSEDLESNPSLQKVLNAFQTGKRSRSGTNGSAADIEWEREREREREAELEMQKLTQQRIREKAYGRRVNGKAKAGDIDAVLDQIKDDWEFVIDPDFNPVDLALELLDESSPGKDMRSFSRTKDMLSKALKGSVDKHYLAFAASLPHHASLLNHLGVAQTQIQSARSVLLEAKDSLGTKRSDLVQLWSRGQTVEEMLRILDQIEHLKAVPDALETLMSEKRLLQASVILIRSLKMINNQDMLEVGAVSDLRGYLVGQETALREILIDELHGHLYLKSFWCESRWASYTPGQQAMPKVEFEEESSLSDTKPISSQATSSTSASPKSSRLDRFLTDLALRPNDPPYDLNEPDFAGSMNAQMQGSSGSSHIQSSASVTTLSSIINSANPTSIFQDSSRQNPESDSFTYIETLLEALAALGKLGSALDIVAQRLPAEIYSVVESTLDEVAERAEYGRRGSFFANASTTRTDGIYVFTGRSGSAATTASLSVAGPAKGAMLSISTLRLAALESHAKHVDHETLKDFFWSLYSKLDAISQGLRVVFEVSNRIGSRRDFRDSSGAKPGSLFPLAEIWMPVQAEVRTLLNDYLNDEEQGAVSGRNPISSINEVLREGKFSRDRTKPVFRFSDTDLKLTNKVLRQHEDDLARVLRDAVPGLVQASTESNVQAALAIMGSTDDRLLGIGQHHRLLVKPDAFHVSVLLQPTLSFLDRISGILPSGLESARAGSAVLDEFVLKVYLPQLEEKVSLLFHQSMTASDAFQPDPASTRLSPEPLIKAATHLMALINSLCDILRTTPFHRENYARLILTVIIQFYQRCSDRFQDLVSHKSRSLEAEPRIVLAAQWAQKMELNPCLSELLNVPETDLAVRQKLCRQETHLELGLLRDGMIEKEHLVASTKNLSALGSLFHSTTWLAFELGKLKSAVDEVTSPTSPVSPQAQSALTAAGVPALPLVQVDEQLSLPLSKEMALRFQALIKTYEQLGELILYTIRIDVRCRTIHYLDLSMRNGSYWLDQEAVEPDPYVIDLNNELVQCEDSVSTTLPPMQQRFIFEGVGHLMEHLLISNARHIHRANDFGIKKIVRNMVALQQNIRTIANATQTKDMEFERAKRYYAMFYMNPTEMLDSIRQKQLFTFDEYKVMLDLQCDVDPSGGENARANASDRNYSMYVIDLHGLELESSAEEG